MSKTISDMQTAYDARAIEPGWYARWEEAGVFTANAKSPKARRAWSANRRERKHERRGGTHTLAGPLLPATRESLQR